MAVSGAMLCVPALVFSAWLSGRGGFLGWNSVAAMWLGVLDVLSRWIEDGL